MHRQGDEQVDETLEVRRERVRWRLAPRHGATRLGATPSRGSTLETPARLISATGRLGGFLVRLLRFAARCSCERGQRRPRNCDAYAHTWSASSFLAQIGAHMKHCNADVAPKKERCVCPVLPPPRRLSVSVARLPRRVRACPACTRPLPMSCRLVERHGRASSLQSTSLRRSLCSTPRPRGRSPPIPCGRRRPERVTVQSTRRH